METQQVQPVAADADEKIAALYDFPEEINNIGDHYDKFAERYDELIAITQFKEHINIPKFVSELDEAKHLINNKEAVIMDYGAGTGRSGAGLKQFGFNVTYATDGSQKMLDKAPEGMYDVKLKHITGVDTLPDDWMNKFDLITSAGSFGPTHIPPVGIEECVNMLKKGGIFAFDLRLKYYVTDEFRYGAYKNTVDKLENAGTIKVLKTHNVQKGYNKGGEVEGEQLKVQEGVVVIMQKLV